MIEVYPIGADVQFGPHSGTVSRIQINPGEAIVYEVGFWSSDGLWHEVWLHDFMVSSAAKKEKIGYSRKGGV